MQSALLYRLPSVKIVFLLRLCSRKVFLITLFATIHLIAPDPISSVSCSGGCILLPQKGFSLLGRLYPPTRRIISAMDKGLPYMPSTMFWDFLTHSPFFSRKIYTVCPEMSWPPFFCGVWTSYMVGPKGTAWLVGRDRSGPQPVLDHSAFVCDIFFLWSTEFTKWTLRCIL